MKAALANSQTRFLSQSGRDIPFRLLAHQSYGWLRRIHSWFSPSAEPVGAGNGGLAGSFLSVVFFMLIGFRAAPDLFR